LSSLLVKFNYNAVVGTVSLFLAVDSARTAVGLSTTVCRPDSLELAAWWT